MEKTVIQDNFIFQCVMQNMKFCKFLLGTNLENQDS